MSNCIEIDHLSIILIQGEQLRLQVDIFYHCFSAQIWQKPFCEQHHVIKRWSIYSCISHTNKWNLSFKDRFKTTTTKIYVVWYPLQMPCTSSHNTFRLSASPHFCTIHFKLSIWQNALFHAFLLLSFENPVYYLKVCASPYYHAGHKAVWPSTGNCSITSTHTHSWKEPKFLPHSLETHPD